MEKQKIDRINELYKKSKAEGLTDAERKEQKGWGKKRGWENTSIT